MGIVKYNGVETVEIEGVKRWNGSEWVDCEEVRQYRNGVWETVWEAIKRIARAETYGNSYMPYGHKLTGGSWEILYNEDRSSATIDTPYYTSGSTYYGGGRITIPVKIGQKLSFHVYKNYVKYDTAACVAVSGEEAVYGNSFNRTWTVTTKSESVVINVTSGYYTSRFVISNITLDGIPVFFV